MLGFGFKLHARVRHTWFRSIRREVPHHEQRFRESCLLPALDGRLLIFPCPLCLCNIFMSGCSLNPVISGNYQLNQNYKKECPEHCLHTRADSAGDFARSPATRRFTTHGAHVERADLNHSYVDNTTKRYSLLSEAR